MNSNAGSEESSVDGGFLEVVLRSVAAREERDVLDLPPLYPAVDPEVMELVLERGIVDTVTFDYLGYEVTVTGEAEVEIAEGDSV